jgi:hypothetical protein
MAFALVSRSRSKTQGSVKPVPKRKSARGQHAADSRFGFAKPVFQPHAAALPTASVIQTKLKVEEPNDKFEQEADQVAELTENGNSSISPSAAAQSRSPVGNLQRLYGNQSMLQMRNGAGGLPAPSVQLVPSPGGVLQRKCACGGAAGMSGECEECSKKRRLGLQTKLKVNEPGDSYEQEADRIADQVLAAPAHHAVSGAPPRIQRFMGQPTGQMDAAPASVDEALASAGRPLEPALREDMEQRFGYDFSRVRMHSGAAAEQSAREVNASAYTVGHAIVFGTGRFAPGTQVGRRLIAHELTHVVQQTTSGAKLQRQSTRNVLRHSGRWKDIDDSPTVLGLWAKEAAINKLWLGSTLREVQEHPERVSELVEAVLPKLRAALYSPKEFSGSPEARRDADEALQMRWPLPGVEGIRDQVLEEFVRRYTKQLEQALAHTPEGTELVTRPEDIWRVRHNPYDGIWWHRMQFIHMGQISPPREILDIKACPKGSEDRCARGDPLRDIWFILKRDPNWIYFSRDQRIDRFDWILHAVSGQVAESTQFAAELFPYLLKLAGFSLGLSSRLAVILTSEILSALGEQGVRAARGEKTQSALEVVKGIGFGVVTSHFLGRLFNKSPGRALEQNLEEATERAAARARVEVARTDASLVERKLRAGRASAVKEPDLIADGYRIEVDVISEGQKHTWRQKIDGTWCRFSDGELCVRQLSDAVDDVARQRPPTIERDLAAAGVSAQALRKLGKNTLSVDDIVAVRQAAQPTKTGWIRVAAAVERAGFERRIYPASVYGLDDYVRYHIRAPGLGGEGFPIPLAKTWMNHGANDIEGFMRAQLKKAFTVEFNVTRTTFAGGELRPFFEDLVQRGSKKTLGRLALDSGRIERFLKSITYDIRLYRRVGNRAESQLWRATMETGTPPLGNTIRLGLPLERVQ